MHVLEDHIIDIGYMYFIVLEVESVPTNKFGQLDSGN